MVVTAMLAAMICVFAPWSVPIGVIPVTLATLAVYVASSVIDWKCCTVAVLIYILIGACGLPVFSNFAGGVQVIAGMTGGYIIGYVPCAMITGFVVDKASFPDFIKFPLGMVLGTFACYALGTAWFMFVSGNTLLYALAVCVVPFLFGDSVKIVIASVLAAAIRKVLQKSYVAKN